MSTSCSLSLLFFLILFQVSGQNLSTDTLIPPPPPPPPLPSFEALSLKIPADTKIPALSGCEDLPMDSCKSCNIAKAKSILYAHLSYPLEAQRQQLRGTVSLSFTVALHGQIENEKIEMDIGGGCGEAILTIIRQLRLSELFFHPGPSRRRPMKIPYRLDIEFGPTMPKG